MAGTGKFRGVSGERVAAVTAGALSLAIGAAGVILSSPRATAAGAGTRPVQIQMKNFAFDPPAISIRAGQTLMWTNDDVVPHTATADKRAWDSGQMAPGHSFRVTVRRPGTYEYTCSIHPFMHAKVVVMK